MKFILYIQIEQLAKGDEHIISPPLKIGKHAVLIYKSVPKKVRMIRESGSESNAANIKVSVNSMLFQRHYRMKEKEFLIMLERFIKISE
ncbi:hypothetical protein CW304_07060 [Bacillus sp. UFRGS-B20]|nr:hypothetical protein CW304_07060 [Bacillus sp. UFRGS-B20]